MSFLKLGGGGGGGGGGDNPTTSTLYNLHVHVPHMSNGAMYSTNRFWCNSGVLGYSARGVPRVG